MGTVISIHIEHDQIDGTLANEIFHAVDRVHVELAKVLGVFDVVPHTFHAAWDAGGYDLVADYREPQPSAEPTEVEQANGNVHIDGVETQRDGVPTWPTIDPNPTLAFVDGLLARQADGRLSITLANGVTLRVDQRWAASRDEDPVTIFGLIDTPATQTVHYRFSDGSTGAATPARFIAGYPVQVPS